MSSSHKHKHRSGSRTPGPSRPSTAPPERSSRKPKRNTSTLAPLGEEPQDGGYDFSQDSSSSRPPFATLDELYSHVVSTEGESSSSQHHKKRSSHRSSQQRYGTPAPESFRSQGSSSSQSAWYPPGPSTAGSSWYSETADRVEATAMQNPHLYQGDGTTLNPILAPFVAEGAEDQAAADQFWTWNPLLQRYTHEDERTNTVMFCPKPDSFP